MKSPVRNADFNTHAIFATSWWNASSSPKLTTATRASPKHGKNGRARLQTRPNSFPARDRIPGPDRIAVIRSNSPQALVVAYLGQPSRTGTPTSFSRSASASPPGPMVMIHEAPGRRRWAVPSSRPPPVLPPAPPTVRKWPAPQQSRDRLVAENNLAQHDHPRQMELDPPKLSCNSATCAPTSASTRFPPRPRNSLSG